MNLKADDVISLEGKTEFGKTFVKENGTDFKISKVNTWDQYQLVLVSLTEKVKRPIIRINLYPESKNFKIIKKN
tara:strand:+ start:139 stop:360 length:222 start_codon:yes stop_codon:yes gene_type:complete